MSEHPVGEPVPAGLHDKDSAADAGDDYSWVDSVADEPDEEDESGGSSAASDDYSWVDSVADEPDEEGESGREIRGGIRSARARKVREIREPPREA